MSWGRNFIEAREHKEARKAANLRELCKPSRALEPVWGADTRRAVIAAGNWPNGLPMLDEAATPLTEAP